MSEVAGLKSASIVYITFVDGVERFRDRMENVQQLAKYFDEHKRKGEAVGYVIVKNRTPGFNDKYLNGKLSIEWKDANGFHTVEFDHVNKFVEFLHQHVTIALMLKYERKRRKRAY